MRATRMSQRSRDAVAVAVCVPDGGGEIGAAPGDGGGGGDDKVVCQ